MVYPKAPLLPQSAKYNRSRLRRESETLYNSTSLRKEPAKDGNGFFRSCKRKAGQEVASQVVEVISSGVENHRRGNVTFIGGVVECEISVGNRVVTPLVG